VATATDFSSWAVPDLVLTLGGHEFIVHPPSVDDMGKLLACAVRGEVNLGLISGTIPAEVQGVLDTIKDEHPALGAAYHEMIAAGINPITIDRMGYYAVFYWARGKDFADRLAVLLWAREQGEAAAAAETTDAVPKA